MSAKRMAMVTGANGVIGKAIARGIAKTEGHGVILVGRNEGRIARAAEEVREATGNQAVRFEVCDQSSKASVKALAERRRRLAARFVIYGLNEMLTYAADRAEIEPFWSRVARWSSRCSRRSRCGTWSRRRAVRQAPRTRTS